MTERERFSYRVKPEYNGWIRAIAHRFDTKPSLIIEEILHQLSMHMLPYDEVLPSVVGYGRVTVLDEIGRVEFGKALGELLNGR